MTDLPSFGLLYPQSTRPVDHEESCAYAYGNTTYPCYCFVRRADAETALAAERARIAEAVRGLPSGVGRVGSRSVSVVDRAAVLAAIDGATPK